MNKIIEIFERITGRKPKESKMSVTYHESTPLDEIIDLAYRTKEALRRKVKIGKPGKKLKFVHTGMLDADGKLIKKIVKEKTKENRKKLKRTKKALKAKRNESKLDTLKRLEKEIKELENRI